MLIVGFFAFMFKCKCLFWSYIISAVLCFLSITFCLIRSFLYLGKTYWNITLTVYAIKSNIYYCLFKPQKKKVAERPYSRGSQRLLRPKFNSENLPRPTETFSLFITLRRQWDSISWCSLITWPHLTRRLMLHSVCQRLDVWLNGCQLYCKRRSYFLFI